MSLVTSLSDFVGSVLKGAKGAFLFGVSGQSSMAAGISAARVEPITLVDTDVMVSDRLEDLLHTSINLYLAIYLQSVALRGATIGSTQIINRLEALNPTSPGENLAYSLEAYQAHQASGVLGAIEPEPDALDIPDVLDQLSVENLDGLLRNKINPTSIARGARKGDHKDGKDRVGGSDDVSGALRDAPELSVGKVFNVELRVDAQTYNIPVTLRLNVTRANRQVLEKAMISRFSSGETSLERKVKWKTGSINSIFDLITNADALRENYKNLIADKDGVYSKLTPNNTTGLVRSIVAGEATIAQASNILIVSQDTAQRVEAQLGGKFENMAFRQRMLRNTGVMLFIVMDSIRDEATIYLESINGGQLVPGRLLKKSAKGDGPNITEVLKAMVAGQPNFLR